MSNEHKEIYLKNFDFTFQRPTTPDGLLFEDRSRVIMSNISHFLKRKIKTKGFWKISLEVNSSNEQQHLKVVGGAVAAGDIDGAAAKAVTTQSAIIGEGAGILTGIADVDREER